MNQQKQSALSAIDDVSSRICQLSDQIWDAPELGFQEFQAAKLYCEMLESLGFSVETNLANIPTAFSGTWGSGRPVIAFMGEFDALSGLSQKAGVTSYDPVVPDGNGHGCGHNLLGCGSLAAAYALKEYLRATGKSGTVIYYGTPAEEGGSGKTFMVREGMFTDLDCVLYWHPSTKNRVGTNTSLANYAVKYRFKGISSHAAAAPQAGRSALDAVELMNTGVQYLREHITQSARIHYAITDAGGVAPGVVQSKAEVYYLIRAPKVVDVQPIYERVNMIAQGAAMMTQTEVEIKFEKACSEQVILQNLCDVTQANMEAVPLPEYTQEDLDFAQAIRESMDKPYDPESSPLFREVVPRVREVKLDYASGDLGDVSQICPTGEIAAATWAMGTSAHTWFATAQGKSSHAKKAMLFAAKVLAGSAIDLVNAPEKLAAIKEEHAQIMKANPYLCPIPKDVPLPVD